MRRMAVLLTLALSSCGGAGAFRSEGASRAPEPSEVPSRPCGGVYASRAAAFRMACPKGWRIWEDRLTKPPDAPAFLLVISNRPPVRPGTDELPDGQVKVDASAEPAEGRTMGDLLRACAAPETSDGLRVTECRTVRVGARIWVRHAAAGDGLTVVAIQSVARGSVYTVIGFVPDGAHGASGLRTVERLLASVRITG